MSDQTAPQPDDDALYHDDPPPQSRRERAMVAVHVARGDAPARLVDWATTVEARLSGRGVYRPSVRITSGVDTVTLHVAGDVLPRPSGGPQAWRDTLRVDVDAAVSDVA